MTEMLGNIREAIQNLAVFFVLSAVLLRLLPGKSYARYLKFFLGLLLAVSLLKPLMTALSKEDLFTDALDTSAEAFDGNSGDSVAGSGIWFSYGSESARASSELKDSIAAASAGEWTAILLAYQGEVQEQINKQIADLGVLVTDISADDGEILTFVIAETEENSDRKTSASVSQAGMAEDADNGAGNAGSGDGENGNTESEDERNADAESGNFETSGNNSVWVERIEIPVISVFAETGKEEEDGMDGENGADISNESGTADGTGNGETVRSIGEISAIVRTRIADYCGIGEEFVEVTVAAD